ncbi:hypothetical protein M514_09615 [Trichuris suis]|uniref:Uncharacterized protein n=1 Tax=Trichuris suis TaxID=68888 RepID=A0A085N882_9BILA|nr:hypothetical protein M514_09615 [Trichuris suis]
MSAPTCTSSRSSASSGMLSASLAVQAFLKTLKVNRPLSLSISTIKRRTCGQGPNFVTANIFSPPFFSFGSWMAPKAIAHCSISLFEISA